MLYFCNVLVLTTICSIRSVFRSGAKQKCDELTTILTDLHKILRDTNDAGKGGKGKKGSLGPNDPTRIAHAAVLRDASMISLRDSAGGTGGGDAARPAAAAAAEADQSSDAEPEADVVELLTEKSKNDFHLNL